MTPPQVAVELLRNQLCSREGFLEPLSFLGWLLIIMAHVAQIWALWWFFWQHVVGDVDWLGFHTGEIITSPQPGALPERTRHSAKIAICSVVWLGWLATAVTARRIFKRVMPAMVYVLYINMYVE